MSLISKAKFYARISPYLIPALLRKIFRPRKPEINSNTTILVDIDNTLTPHPTLEKMLENYPALQKYQQERRNNAMNGIEVPEIGMEKVWKKVAKKVKPKEWHELAKKIIQQKELNHSLIADLRRARKKGARIILASMGNHYIAEALNQELDFDGFVASGVETTISPRPTKFGQRFKTKFEAANEKYGLQRENTIQISDALHHDAGTALKTYNLHVDYEGKHEISKLFGAHTITFGEKRPLEHLL